MQEKTKKSLIIILGLVLLVIFILISTNLIGVDLYNKKTTSQTSQANISGKSDSEFIAETVSNSTTIEYTFTPKTEEEKNYLLTYELKKDGELIDFKNKELVTNISKNSPISFDVKRDNKSEYSLNTIIFDADNPAKELHNDQIVIHPQEKQPLKNDEKTKDLFSDYIKENINNLSPEEAVLGGSFYVTKINFLNANSALVDYEDGHIALSALVEFYLNDEKIEITSFKIKEDGFSFSEIGNIVSSDSGWEIVYEKPGKPALREALIFNDNSKCLDEGVDSVCDSSYWENGDRVKIDGELKNNGIEVTTLTTITENSQAIPHANNDLDSCQEKGGIVMFPECVGCEPYCSFNEEEVINETSDNSNDICVDKCGNGECEEIVCMGEGCPCAETSDNCPADCN